MKVQLRTWLRPALPSFALLMGISILWMAYVMKDENVVDPEEVQNNHYSRRAVTILHSLILIPSFVAVMAYGNIIQMIWRWDLRRQSESSSSEPNNGDEEANKTNRFVDVLAQIRPVMTPREHVYQQQAEQLEMHAPRVTRLTTTGTMLHLLAPIVSLFVLVLIRLFVGTSTFLGDPAVFDFGYSNGVVTSDTNTNANTTATAAEVVTKNVAFGSSSFWESFGTCLAGLLATWLTYPLVSRFIRDQIFTHALCGCLDEPLRLFIRWAPAVLCWLPTAYLLRYTGASSSRTVFAASPFARRTLEWLYGAMVGCAWGNLVTALSAWSNVWNIVAVTSGKGNTGSGGDSEQGIDVNCWPWADSSNTQSPAATDNDRANERPCCYKVVERVMGALLLLTGIVAAVLMARTWHDCLEGTTDCINGTASASTTRTYDETSLLIGFVVPPAIVYFVMVWTIRSRTQTDAM